MNDDAGSYGGPTTTPTGSPCLSVTLIIDLIPTPTPIGSGPAHLLTWCPVVERLRWRRGRWTSSPATQPPPKLSPTRSLHDPLPHRGPDQDKLDLIPSASRRQTQCRRGHTGYPLLGIRASHAPASSCSQTASTPT